MGYINEDIQIAVNSAIDTTLKIPSGKEYHVKLTSCKPLVVSEVGAALSKNCDFAVIYKYDIINDNWNLSCRASKENIDLSIITKEFQGGGHPKAAGFTIKNKENALLSLFKKI